MNNSEDAANNVRDNNLLTLKTLENSSPPYELNWVNAASEGLGLSARVAGVGLARKIGMDLCLPYARPGSLFCCLDADTLVDQDYLQTIETYFSEKDSPAAVLDFRHQPSENGEIEEAVRLYENFIKTTAQKLRAAGSPYGYHSIGSTIACTVEGYCAVGGMSRKKAGEDFYFLQEIAKYRKVGIINKILVHPSPRLSERVYLGTGVRLKQALAGFSLQRLFYSDKAFSVLEKLLVLAGPNHGNPLEKLLSDCSLIDARLPEFLERENIHSVWEGLQGSSPSKNHFIKQFNRWFDGLKTMRLLKYYSQE
ncbi:MAG: hypothetical protein GXO91_01505 [FCB group bacterium]|nr:hypothetical protein [FCB group bacterium]